MSSDCEKKSSSTDTTTSTGSRSAGEKGAKKLKICCACPETRKLRDECIVENGEVNCASVIEAHKACLRENGFNV